MSDCPICGAKGSERCTYLDRGIRVTLISPHNLRGEPT